MAETIRVTKNEATAARRRAYFYCLDATDGITPETGENGGQPQISIDGAAFTNTGIGTLVSIGSGDYYADVTQATVNVDNAVIRTRYKSSNTAEARGSILVVSDNWDYMDASVADVHTDVGSISTTLSTVSSNVSTINGHITADYGSTEKAAIDLLDDVSGGLADIHTDVAANNTILTLVNKWIQDKLVTSDNGDGTLTTVLYDTNNTTPLLTWVFTTATGTRAKAT